MGINKIKNKGYDFWKVEVLHKILLWIKNERFQELFDSGIEDFCNQKKKIIIE